MREPEKKLSTWRARFLSQSGRLILINSVLASLPNHFMELFKMQSVVATELHSLMANFLWSPIDKRKIHWVKWHSMTKPCDFGGLAIPNFKIRNAALLNRWLWRFEKSLWRRVVGGKYKEDSNQLLPMNFSIKNKSWVWKDITKALIFGGV